MSVIYCRSGRRSACRDNASRWRRGATRRGSGYGDFNLDGTVDFSDLLAVAQHYNGPAAGWTDGDFNYDGKVNFADLLALAQNYKKAAAPFGFRTRVEKQGPAAKE
jgi:hypothetical protein